MARDESRVARVGAIRGAISGACEDVEVANRTRGFGIFRPVLLLPEDIKERLTRQQLRAILIHEFSHVRRRDNLTAALHTLVEAAFWFHPMVWWIGARLVDERERACDEEVLRRGSEAETYAEGILNVCRWYIESPAVCAAGVTGSNLEKRIEEIMSAGRAIGLSRARKLAMAALGAAALVLPVAIGVAHAPAIWAQSTDWEKAAGGKAAFEVASVKPAGQFHMPPFPLNDQDGKAPGGRFLAAFSLDTYISFAFKLTSVETRHLQLDRLPAWVHTQMFEIDAKAEGNPTKDQMRLMMQSLLANRFKLAAHFETREVPVFALELVKPGVTGPKLHPHSEGPPCPDSHIGGQGWPPKPPTDTEVFPPNCGTMSTWIKADGVQKSGSRDVSMPFVAEAMYTMLGRDNDRPVVDHTSLIGNYDFTLEISGAQTVVVTDKPEAATPDVMPVERAMRDQLGLKLVPSKGPIRVLVIDHIERPSGN